MEQENEADEDHPQESARIAIGVQAVGPSIRQERRAVE
jgi:hypothetical protein